jgi:beta-galactosidase/beta-glucuronidase
LARIVTGADGRVEMRTDNLPPSRRMTMPCRWSEGGLQHFAGRVRYRRRFGYPGRIDSDERVWLTFAGADSLAEVSLNNRFLGRHEGADEPFEFEVTNLLQDRNELIVEVESPTETGGLWGEVALEIRQA